MLSMLVILPFLAPKLAGARHNLANVRNSHLSGNPDIRTCAADPSRKRSPMSLALGFHPCAGLGNFDLEGAWQACGPARVSERAAASLDCEVLVGAGTGFEPVTFRL